MSSHQAILVLCTAPNAEVAADLAKGLVEQKLAACVNVIPGLRSFFFWDGAVRDEQEVQLFIKTRRPLFASVEAWLDEHHPYDVPEVIAFDVTAGSEAYLKWLVDQTTG